MSEEATKAFQQYLEIVSVIALLPLIYVFKSSDDVECVSLYQFVRLVLYHSVVSNGLLSALAPVDELVKL